MTNGSDPPALGESAAEILIQVFHHCMKDEKYLQSTLNTLSPEDLPDHDLRWLYKEVAKVWTSHREIIPRLVLERRANRAKRGREEKLKIVETIFDDEEGYPKLAAEELFTWVRTRRLHNTLVDVVEYADKDIDRAYEVLQKVVVKDSVPPTIDIQDWFQSFEERQVKRRESSKDPYRVIPTGYQKIDEALSGGVAREELALILAPTSRGKSMALCDIGYRNAAAGFQVTHITLEMSLQQTATRYDARWSKVNSNRFKTFDFDTETLEILDAKKRRALHLNNKLQIVHIPVDQCDVNTIRSVLGTLKERSLPDTDLLLVDSADHMASIRQFEQKRHEHANVYWGLKSIAQEYDCAVITSTHASKEWAEKLIKAEATAESYDKARIADIIISLNKSKQEGRSDVSKYLDLYLAKYRDGEDKFTVPVKVTRSMMLFEETWEDDEPEE